MPNNTMTPGDELDLGHHSDEVTDGPVECLGKTFENDQARREHYLEILADKLKDPEFRKIEGFPKIEDEDVLELSDPPYYTACPNPFLNEFLESSQDSYLDRLPYTADVSEGKNDPLYNAHSYHTKVPHKAIMKYILHYTNPGDAILDGFCGTGMAGMAAQLCDNVSTLKEIGYRVEGTNIIDQISGEKVSELGARYAVLNDLSPIASFMSYNYNKSIDIQQFGKLADSIFKSLVDEWSWAYQTEHLEGGEGEIVYTIWSELHVCESCGAQVPYWNIITDGDGNYLEDKNGCPDCGAEFSSRNPTRAMETIYDEYLNKEVTQVKCIPVHINYKVSNKRFTKKPDLNDMKIIEESGKKTLQYIPTAKIEEGDRYKRDALGLKGITHTHHFFTKRNFNILNSLFKSSTHSDRRMNNFLRIWNTSTISRLHKLNRYIPKHNRHVGPMSGTLYVSPLWVEISPFYFVHEKLKAHKALSLPKASSSFVSNGSAAKLLLNDNSIDYIFTDPPFGANLQYAELNVICEAWINSVTNSQAEVVVNAPRGKDLKSYEDAMTDCFKEYYRVLKSGKWITIEFHNSKNSVWVAIQEALIKSGFIVSDVRVLDKKKGTTKQLSMTNAVKQDLIITAYKPGVEFKGIKELDVGTEETCWTFVREHLKHLPKFVELNGVGEIISERQPYVLFDRMVAYHVQNEISVPLSTVEFYQGLTQRFSQRDGMIFLTEDVDVYDKHRNSVDSMQQLEIFVSDEESAIMWLKACLNNKPMKYQDIHPLFMKEASGWNKNEVSIELQQILEENFIQYSSLDEPVPSQVHSYLSSNYKDCRNLQNDSGVLKEKAKGRWYIPNPQKAQDLEKIRDKSLLKEFEKYKEHQGKKLKEFRSEALRTGFKVAWQNKDYETIITVAEKIPDAVIQEDPKLLMWYDQAQTRHSDESLF